MNIRILSLGLFALLSTVIAAKAKAGGGSDQPEPDKTYWLWNGCKRFGRWYYVLKDLPAGTIVMSNSYRLMVDALDHAMGESPTFNPDAAGLVASYNNFVNGQAKADRYNMDTAEGRKAAMNCHFND